MNKCPSDDDGEDFQLDLRDFSEKKHNELFACHFFSVLLLKSAKQFSSRMYLRSKSGKYLFSTWPNEKRDFEEKIDSFLPNERNSRK